MKLITHTAQTTKTVFVASGMFLSMLFAVPYTVSAQMTSTFTPLTAQMSLGSRGINVTNLQSFLASIPTIYPEGLVTGYYGALTVKAVKAFQIQYGIESVGRVGPMTLLKMNSLIMGGSQVNDMRGPWIQMASTMPQVTQNSVSFSWNTDESTTGVVYYDKSPVSFNEGDINSVGFGPRTGFTAHADTTLRNSHMVTISNLTPNTTYYYTVAARDAAGNVSVFNPNGTFRTNQ